MLDATTALEAKVDTLTRRFNLLMIEKASLSFKIVMLCETYRGGHNPSQCPISGTPIVPMEQVDLVSGGQRPRDNLYHATYNPGK